MNKQDFIKNLQAKLHGLPEQEAQERLNFYSEMIDDRIEEGLSEEDAVLAIGSVDEIASQIINDSSLAKNGNQKIKPKRKMKGWVIALLVIGSPIWATLLIAVLGLIISLFVELGSFIISLWAVFISLVSGALGGLILGVCFVISGNIITGIFAFCIAVFSTAFAILLFFVCKAATKGVIFLVKKIILGIKKCFANKVEA